MSFSIVIPCYNCEKTLERTVQSLINQHDYLSNIVLIDDGSQDNTAFIADQLRTKHPGLIDFYSQPNQGPAAARNHGMKYVRGDYVIFLDSDDCLTPDALKTFSSEFDQNRDLEMIVAGYRAIRPKKESIKLPKSNRSSESLLRDFCSKKVSISGGAVAMRTQVLQSAQYPTSIKHGEDLVFFSRLLSKHTAAPLPFVALNVYHHADSLRHDHPSILRDEDKMVELLFDDKYIPNKIMRLKPAYHARYLLHLATVALNAKDGKLAKDFLKKAFSISPKSFMNWKAIKTTLRIYYASR